jgi:raffinose/stachyose/melibiose transport system permease protein
MTRTRPFANPFAGGLATERFVTRFFSHLILIIFVVMMAYPVLWMMISSLKTRAEFMNNIWGLPQTITFQNYPDAFERANLGRAFLNSLLISGSTVLLVLAGGTLAGYALARYRLRFGLAIFLLFVLTMQAPVPIVPLYVLIAKLKLTDTYLGLILPLTAGGLPLAIFILRAFFTQIPGELIEAGVVDGCSRWGVFVRIVLPISGPAIATVTILQFLSAWNEFQLPLVLTHSADMSTIPLAIQAFSYQFGRVDWQPVFASLTFGSIPMIILYLFLQRWFIQGLTSGAVKG